MEIEIDLWIWQQMVVVEWLKSERMDLAGGWLVSQLASVATYFSIILLTM